MRHLISQTLHLSLSLLLIPLTLTAAEPETGFKPLFDGKTLSGWTGDSNYWRVEDGTIIGESTLEKPLTENTFLLWDQGVVDDFELRVSFRLTGSPSANSGIQFRSALREDGHVMGYQADIDKAGKWVGSIYDEVARGTLAQRGHQATIDSNGKITTTPLGDVQQILNVIKQDDWNEYTIRAQGSHLTLTINGVTTADVIDNDPAGLDRSGLLALQVHSGPAMKIEFKNLRLKRLPLEDGWKKVVFIAGRPSHAYFAHEHNAGCLLLAEALKAAQQNQGLKIITANYSLGWPQDPTALDNANTVVAYCDGGKGHFLNDYLDVFDNMVEQRHVGLVCLHYGVETLTGQPGDHFLKWIGGFFETYWSINPSWTANYTSFPDHPITRGVEPFEIRDEWYYHMRFVDGMQGVTPILSDLPPRETLTRKDGPHENNPAVRQAVLVDQQPQVTAWAYERPDGKGRGFGFTGGHMHGNWQHDQFRKIVLNAIVWTAGGDIPSTGINSPTPSDAQMQANQDDAPPKNFQFKSFLGQ